MNFNKIFLINPNYPKSFYPLPVWPLGLGYIAEALKNNGIAYKVIDLSFGYKDKLLFQRIREFSPDAIGLTLMTSKYKHHYALIQSIKNNFPNIPIIAGGPHISTLGESALRDCAQIDFGLAGEGEESLIELCKGKDLSLIKGLIYRNGREIVCTGGRPRILDLDSVPFPKFDGFEIEKYDTKSMNILSSRGCPHGCIYCCVKLVSGNKWQPRSPENVIKEIQYWHNRGYRVFNFSDDAFNIDEKRVLEICDGIEKLGLKVELNAPNGIRADRAGMELLTRMKRAGFRSIAFGVEAGNDKVLSRIKKGEKIGQIEKAIKDACDLKYEVALFFLIGSPGESKEDIEDSFRLVLKYPIVDFRFYNLIPFPNTELYEWLEENNYFTVPPEKYLNENTMTANKPVFRTPELSIIERERIYERGLKLGDKLRRKYLFRYYLSAFKGLGLFSGVISYLASRDIFQFLLKNNRSLQNLRLIFKKKGLFTR